MSGIKTFDELPRPRRGSAPPAVREAREVPLIGVIRNTRSHRNTGREQGEAPGAEVILESTQKRRELYDVLDRFAQKGVDYLAISGGDGTVRDVLTGGAEIFGDDWPTLIVLPKGKTNALATDLGAPADWRLALLASGVAVAARVADHPDQGRFACGASGGRGRPATGPWKLVECLDAAHRRKSAYPPARGNG